MARDLVVHGLTMSDCYRPPPVGRDSGEKRDAALAAESGRVFFYCQVNSRVKSQSHASSTAQFDPYDRGSYFPAIEITENMPIVMKHFRFLALTIETEKSRVSD